MVANGGRWGETRESLRGGGGGHFWPDYTATNDSRFRI